MINSVKRCKHRKYINHNTTGIAVMIVLIGTKVSIVAILLASGRCVNSNANSECRGTQNTCDICPTVLRLFSLV
jgi:divalent metal cation (Fe/Co/Zn/Cd) transporter